MNRSYIPTKTKIAAWIMMVIGGTGIIGGLLVAILGLRHNTSEFQISYLLLGAVVFVLGSLYFFSGIFLFGGTRRDWILSVGILCIEMLFPLVVIWYSLEDLIHGWFVTSVLYAVILLLLFLFTLILLLFDRKNYWKIAS